MKPAEPTKREPSDHVLPDFCAPGGLLLLVLMGAALTLVLTLAGLRGLEGFWAQLGLNGLFVQWLILSAAAVLCGVRRFLERFSQRTAVWLVFVIIQLIVLVYSWLIVMLRDLIGALDVLAFSDPDLFILRNLGISMIASFLLVRYLALQQRWRRQLAAESTARLEALQARIRPHFLFNALNTISSLIRTSPEQAEEAILDLSDLLRTGLGGQGRHTLAVELELVRGYLRIESLRLGRRLTVEWALDENLPGQQKIPALLIQPLVENAVVHGIARIPEGGRLTINGRRDGNRLRFAVENPLPAHQSPEDADAPDSQAPGSRGNSMALDNIRQRLELAYAERARLKTSLSDGRFRVELVLPVEN